MFKEIESLKNVEFPRCLQPKEVSGVSELHVFADASKTAYGAVAYLVWMTPHVPHVSLVSAKARVAPLHHTTIPRLELMAALVASRLAQIKAFKRHTLVGFYHRAQLVTFRISIVQAFR